MKKLFALLLIALVSVAVLAACGGEKTPDETTDNGKETTAGPEEFKPEIIPASAINPRKIVLDYMYKMANLEWTPSQDIDLTEIISTLYYKKGVKYKGIMYVTGDRTMTDYDEFMAQLNEKGEYIGPVDRQKGWGNHCSSAIRLAYDQIDNSLTFGYTGGMVPSRKQGTIIVGDYKYEDDFTTTDEIIAINNANVMYEAYQQLQPGDCILTCWGPTGHARMIVELKIEKSAAGKVNATRSGVVCIEQTSSFDKSRTDGVNTTWYVEHFYSFADLYKANYIPLTIAPLQVTDHKDTEFTCKSLNTAENMTEGKLKGIVRSSYADIKSITVEVIDKDGNVVVTDTLANKNKDHLVFQFNNAKAPEGMTTLAAGDYKYLVTANTLYGSAKVAQVEFTVQ